MTQPGSPKRRLLVLVSLLVPILGLISLMAWALAQSGGNPGGLRINSKLGEVSVTVGPAPGLSLQLLQGGVLDLESLKGKVVMIDFWSSWCPPCIAEAPDLAMTYRLYQGKDVEFIGVAIWDEESEVRKFVDKFNIGYPTGIDAQGKVGIAYGVRGIPEKFFVDRQGRLVSKFVGPMKSEELKAIIDALLAQGA